MTLTFIVTYFPEFFTQVTYTLLPKTKQNKRKPYFSKKYHSSRNENKVQSLILSWLFWYSCFCSYGINLLPFKLAFLLGSLDVKYFPIFPPTFRPPWLQFLFKFSLPSNNVKVTFIRVILIITLSWVQLPQTHQD